LSNEYQEPFADPWRCRFPNKKNGIKRHRHQTTGFASLLLTLPDYGRQIQYIMSSPNLFCCELFFYEFGNALIET